jgi:NUMOD4 motif
VGILCILYTKADGLAVIEKWREVVGYEGMYTVSNLGRVKSLARNVRGGRGGLRPIKEAFLTPVVMSVGYPAVTLRNGKTAVKRYVHDLVLRAFRGPPQEGQYARHHPDPTKTNCVLSNLCWGSPAQNTGDHFDRYISDEDIKEMHTLRDVGWAQKDISARFRCQQSYVSRVLNNLERPVENPSNNVSVRGMKYKRKGARRIMG